MTAPTHLGVPARLGWMVMAAAVLAVGSLAACGDTATTGIPAWVAKHPATHALRFDAAAPGVCALTVQYPEDAPAAIEFTGVIYVQRSRSSRPAHPAGRQVDQSGDWTFFETSSDDLLLVTPRYAYDFHLESGC